MLIAKLSTLVYRYPTKLMIISQFSPEHYRVQIYPALNIHQPSLIAPSFHWHSQFQIFSANISITGKHTTNIHWRPHTITGCVTDWLHCPLTAEDQSLPAGSPGNSNNNTTHSPPNLTLSWEFHCNPTQSGDPHYRAILIVSPRGGLHIDFHLR